MSPKENEFLKAALESRVTGDTPCLNEDHFLAFYSGQLGKDEAEQVRDHLAECPKCLELARDARQFLKAMSAPVPAAAPNAQPESLKLERGRGERLDSRQSPWSQSLLQLFQKPFFGFSMAAAVALLLISCAFFMVRNLQLQNQIEQMNAGQTQSQRREQELRAQLDEQTRHNRRIEEQQSELEKDLAALKAAKVESNNRTSAPLVIASLVLLPGVRDPENPNELIIPPGATLVRLRANLESDDYPRYRAVLRTADGEVIWGRSGLKAQSIGSGKAVVLHLPPKLFTIRDYVLSISGVTADGKSAEVEQYSFRVGALPVDSRRAGPGS